MELQQVLQRLQGLPRPTYLVGGALRDQLLGRQKNPLDLDLVLPGEALSWGSRLAREWGGVLWCWIGSGRLPGWWCRI
ncbi:MAG: hypothetical protein Q6K08_03395 [Thermostichales cyanobacterium GMQP_bins_62]